MSESDAFSPHQSSSETSPLIKTKFDSWRYSKVQDSKCWKFFSTVFPILRWLPNYNFKWLQYDIIAGLTVGLTVMPQGLAYAQIADLPLQYGLYTSFMGGFIYCILGTSKDITLGPTAIMSLFVRTHGQGDVVQVVILTLLGGCIQLVMGVLRLGFIMRYLSVPVVSGFTSAAAITIGFGQLKHILGIKVKSTEYFIPEVIETFKNIGNANGWDVLVGLCSLAVLVVLRFANKNVTRYPTDTKLETIAKVFLWFVCTARNAIIVLCTAAIAYAIHTQHITSCRITDCITLTGFIDKGLPPFKPPAFSEVKGNQTITAAEFVGNIGVGLIVVPLMGFLESIAIGKAFARKDGYVLDVNQEMIAIGVANIFGSFVSSYTVTGSFSRTAINNQSKVMTPAGGIFTGLLVIMGLLFLTPVFYYIPKASLAAVIISAVVFMVDYQTVLRLWRSNKLDLVPLVVTFLTCFWYIPYGIIAGVGVSLLILLFPISFPDVTFTYLPVVGEETRELLIITIRSTLNFPCAEFICNKVKKQVELRKDSICVAVLDLQHVSTIDFTSAQALCELSVDLERQRVRLAVMSALDSIQVCLLKTCGSNAINCYKDIEEVIDEC